MGSNILKYPVKKEIKIPWLSSNAIEVIKLVLSLIISPVFYCNNVCLLTIGSFTWWRFSKNLCESGSITVI